MKITATTGGRLPASLRAAAKRARTSLARALNLTRDDMLAVGGKRFVGLPDATPRRLTTGLITGPPRSARPSFDFKPHGTSGRVMIGNRRSVLVRHVGRHGRGIVFQRRGRGKRSDLVPLFTVRARLRRPGMREVGRVVREKFSPHLRRAMSAGQ